MKHSTLLPAKHGVSSNSKRCRPAVCTELAGAYISVPDNVIAVSFSLGKHSTSEVATLYNSCAV
jgi:hypothetical protein